jgi:hypothetical protein
MAQRFGVTWQFFREMSVLALVLAAFVAASSMIALWLSDASLLATLGFSSLLGTLVLLVVAAVFALISGFSVHVTELSVQQLLWGRFVMSEYPLSDFVEANEERGVLRFTNRRQLRLAGMHQDEIARLADCITVKQSVVATRPNKSLERTRAK